ncbi:DUF429 domain-containing protein [Zavarzinia sp. CC-PAN008]|uniref:DUF429 domain-containing protein n=1 Tax=Zavarzinia sp. CC-PAN008 TaxID=3243332 RepID=UPI003F7429FA
MRTLGIDFSGNHLMWRASLSAERANVWIASIVDGHLADLRPVQALAGEGTPFSRLVAVLAAADFDVAAIDAPCALPQPWCSPRDGLLARIAALPCPGRPFPSGRDLLALAGLDGQGSRARRQTEREEFPGLNVRPTLWHGGRPGAPFAMACLRLLAESGAPCWPWVACGPGMVAEAFPMGQLQAWGLPHLRYGRPDGGAERVAIVARLGDVLDLGVHRARLEATPDALDAVVLALTAGALAQGRIPRRHAEHLDEGWIAVDRVPL